MMIVHGKPIHLMLQGFSVLLLLLHVKAVTGFNSGTGGAKFRCIERERQALLKFKQALVDDSGVLSSWRSDEESRDCCKWRGVGCNNRTGHVTVLDLQWADDSMPLQTEISDSLLELQHLNYLGISHFDFWGSPFPNFIGRLTNLRYLNLSSNRLTGNLSDEIRNLSRLLSLDLSGNNDVKIGSLGWLKSLASLEHLDLSDTDLSQASDWMQVINSLPAHLKDLSLSYCQLPNVIPPSLPFTNSSKSLAVLDLSGNLLTFSVISPWLSNFSSTLVDLKLSENWDISPENMDWFPYLSSLENLDLFGNNLSQASDWLQLVSKLPHLKVLNLRACSLSDTVSPMVIFTNSSKSLAVLDLSINDLPCSVFPWLSNFSSSLVDLALTRNWVISPENMDWFPSLSSLENLDLTVNNFSQVSDWLQLVSKLPHLKVLNLSDCSLPDTVSPTVIFTNSSGSLAVLDIANNNLASSIFLYLSNLSNSLVDLDLSYNQLQDSIPDAFKNMISLTYLDLSFNQLKGISRSFQLMCSLRELSLEFNNLNGQLSQFFENMYGCMENSLEILRLKANQLHGSLPDISRFSFMKELDLSGNQLNGTLPKRFSQHSKLVSLILSDNQLRGSVTDVAMLSSLRQFWIDGNRFDGIVSASIGSLSHLEELQASGNSLQGVMFQAHFSNLSRLQILDFSDSSLILKLGSNWTPPFQLDSIRLKSCTLGPHFPKWLRNQHNFYQLDISGAGISDIVPSWFWDLSNSKVVSLNLSHNQMRGRVPDLSSKYPALYGVDLRFNEFEGPIPHFPSSYPSTVEFSNNMFSGPISRICEMLGGGLRILDLSNNRLTGPIPDCLTDDLGLVVLNLANNNISGAIPRSMGSFFMLQVLSLRNNSIAGELPVSLKNCSELRFLDVSRNKLNGEIPGWIGESLSRLTFLSLQSNEFHGRISPHLCRLSYVQILDLSLNNFSGVIPKCLNNFTAMIQKADFNGTDIPTFIQYRGPPEDIYSNKAWVEWKGRQYEYDRNLGLLRIIDFACNKLIGEIPEEITSLSQLVALNMSGNNLSGVIPRNIGLLKQLESLDLSGNHLSGVIPASTADLHFLSYLNLSHNNLSGRIPTSTQLQSFSASVFAGNLALCGLPVAQKCPGDEIPRSPPTNDDDQFSKEKADEFWKWFYTSMGIGFGVFFWGVSGALLLKRSWRHAYFRMLDESWDWLYITIAVNKKKLLRKFQRQDLQQQ